MPCAEDKGNTGAEQVDTAQLDRVVIAWKLTMFCSLYKNYENARISVSLKLAGFKDDSKILCSDLYLIITATSCILFFVKSKYYRREGYLP